MVSTQVVTENGEAPLRMSKYRPGVMILAVCVDERIARTCALLRGVVPLVVKWKVDDQQNEFAVVSVQRVIDHALVQASKLGIVASGDKVVCLHDTDIDDDSELDDWVMRMAIVP